MIIVKRSFTLISNFILFYHTHIRPEIEEVVSYVQNTTVLSFGMCVLWFNAPADLNEVNQD